MSVMENTGHNEYLIIREGQYCYIQGDVEGKSWKVGIIGADDFNLLHGQTVFDSKEAAADFIFSLD